MMLDRTVAPPLAPLNGFQLPRPQKLKLGNGAQLTSYHDQRQALFNWQLIYPISRWQEDKKGQAMLTARMLTEGTPRYTSKEIYDRLGYLGVHLSIQPGYDYTVIDLFGMSRVFEGAFDLVTHLLENASFPEKEFDLLCQNTIQQIKINEQKNNIKAGKLLRQSMYGKDHPYGYALLTSDIEQIQPSDLKSFVGKFRQAPLFSYLTGSYSTHDFDLASNWIGAKHRVERPAPQNFSISPSDNAPVFFEKENALQTSIRIGRPLSSVTSTDQPLLDLANHLLGGYFGSKLMQNLREEKGITYGVSSQIIYHQCAAHLIIGTDVQKKDTKVALEQIDLELENILNGKVSTEEFNQAKNHLLGGYLKSIHSPFSLVELFKNIDVKQLSVNFYDEYVDIVQNAGEEKVVEVLRGALKGAKQTIWVG